MSNKIYFASDMHFGAPNPERSRVREKHFIKWLRSIQDDAAELYLLGDIFDFWFEYKKAVPKGFVRLLGTLADLSDSGVKLHIFAGNHDLWYHDYLKEEIEAHIYHQPQQRNFFGREYYLAHGDGLGPGDYGYKIMKKVITAPISKWLFHRLHPNAGIGLALWVSTKGGDHNYESEGQEAFYYGQDDYLYIHSLETLKKKKEIDCFIYGHRHVCIQDHMPEGQEMIILGDWIQYFSYLEVSPEGNKLSVFPL
ncbi:MAG: UDP-2,3-diacylglucosamine diphosphatase [Bacteroidota bacterium]